MRKGFTLIELMIVMAIVGIVAAVFLPAIFGSKADSNVSWGWAQERKAPHLFIKCRPEDITLALLRGGK